MWRRPFVDFTNGKLSSAPIFRACSRHYLICIIFFSELRAKLRRPRVPKQAGIPGVFFPLYLQQHTHSQ